MRTNNLSLRFAIFLILGFTATKVGAQELTARLMNASHPKGLFNPLFFRAGLTSGVLTSTTGSLTTSTIGLRTEYGLSKAFSVVGEAQVNKGNSSFSGGQGTLAMRYMPFVFKRIQPYVSVGFGVGPGKAGQGGHCHHNQQAIAVPVTQVTGETTTVLPSNPSHRLAGLAIIQIGVNLKLSSHFIAHAETLYQMHMSRHAEPGGLGFRMGMSYQFGKN